MTASLRRTLSSCLASPPPVLAVQCIVTTALPTTAACLCSVFCAMRFHDDAGWTLLRAVASPAIVCHCTAVLRVCACARVNAGPGVRALF